VNLSILLTGGKETNKDSLSSGERSGKSSTLESEHRFHNDALNCSVWMAHHECGVGGCKFFGTRHQRG